MMNDTEPVSGHDGDGKVLVDDSRASHTERTQSPYQPLQKGEIRVLCLEPGLEGSPLVATLEHVQVLEDTSDMVYLDDFVDRRCHCCHVARDEGTEMNEVADNSQVQLPHDSQENESDTLGQPALYNYEHAASFHPSELKFATFDYEAISYAWGGMEASQTLRVSGYGLVRITPSLHSALNQFRNTDKVRRLWADALCINQCDEVEKGQQVTAMDEIYKGARTVLVWLGPAEEDDHQAFSTVELWPRLSLWWIESQEERYLEEKEYRLAREDLTDDTRTWMERSDDSSKEYMEWAAENHYVGVKTAYETHDMLSFIGENTLASDKNPIAGLLEMVRLLLRPWFARLWVLQEVIAKAMVHGEVIVRSGSHSGVFGDLANMAALLERMVPYIEALERKDEQTGTVLRALSVGTADTVQRVIRSYGHDLFGDSLAGDWPCRLVTTTAFWLRFGGVALRDCHNPSDRIYAVRSLLGLQRYRCLMPDYSLPVHEVYSNFTKVVMSRTAFYTKGIYAPLLNHTPWMPLALVGTESDRSTMISKPSWIPDYHHLTDDSLGKLKLYQSKGGGLYYPAPELFKWNWSDNCIVVKGRCFATIRSILTTSSWPEPYDEATQCDIEQEANIMAWYRTCQDFALPILARSSECLLDRFHALLAARSLQALCADECSASRRLAKAMLSTWKERDTQGGWLACLPIYDFLKQVLTAHRGTSCYTDKNRLLCDLETDSGIDIGWVPKLARPGDKLCIFAGAPFPFVLRDLGDGCFTLLGDAYLAISSLKQALGGRSDGTAEVLRPRKHMSWHGVEEGGCESYPSPTHPEADEEMLSLIDGLGWIILT
ncbi:Non-essential glycogen phosphorylase [Elasticomyces elasticus]|nr:Non-essential glycogen phosphorylase [Elasticomyces elasticus]